MSDHSAELIQKISSLVLSLMPDGPRRFYLYVEAASNTCAASIYQEFDDRAVWLDPSSELFDELLELWAIADDDKKWGTLTLSIDDQRFAANFDYDRRLDVEDDLHDYREDALLKRYGDKPIIYPPPPADAVEWRPAS